MIHKDEWQLVTQALLDAEGYPKSGYAANKLGYSAHDIRTVLDRLLKDEKTDLTDKERQVILNSLDGALDYVDTDIPSLYDVSQEELRDFRKSLERRWGIKSTYGASG